MRKALQTDFSEQISLLVLLPLNFNSSVMRRTKQGQNHALHGSLEWGFLKNVCHAKSLQSCPTLGHLTDCSPAGSAVRGILQARILEWVAISFSLKEKKLASVLTYLRLR